MSKAHILEIRGLTGETDRYPGTKPETQGAACWAQGVVSATLSWLLTQRKLLSFSEGWPGCGLGHFTIAGVEGTHCDELLSQMVAECLGVSSERTKLGSEANDQGPTRTFRGTTEYLPILTSTLDQHQRSKFLPALLLCVAFSLPTPPLPLAPAYKLVHVGCFSFIRLLCLLLTLRMT